MNVCAKILILSCIYGLSVTVQHHLNSEGTVGAVQMIEDGFSQPLVARALGVSPSFVKRLWAHYLEARKYSRRPGQGRQRATTERQDRYLPNLALRNRQATAKGLLNDFQFATRVRVSNQTVRNRLHGDSLHARRPATGPILTVAHRTDRRIFAQNHIGWQLDQWRTVLFTDESRFHVCTCDRRIRVWRRVGERYVDCNIVERDRFGGGSVMFWGGICYDGRTELYRVERGSLTALRCRDKILDPIVRPFLCAMGDNARLVQNNARPHTAYLKQDYLEQESIETIDWPAMSPDLNCIEHMWEIVYRQVSVSANPPRSVQELEISVVQAWTNVLQQQIRTLVQSIPNCCRECLDSRGGHTHY